MVVGLKIRKLRELKNYSQEFMADQLGISQNVYGRIERSEQELTIDRLYRIAEILKIKAVDLLESELAHLIQNNRVHVHSHSDLEKDMITNLSESPNQSVKSN